MSFNLLIVTVTDSNFSLNYRSSDIILHLCENSCFRTRVYHYFKKASNDNVAEILSCLLHFDFERAASITKTLSFWGV